MSTVTEKITKRAQTLGMPLRAEHSPASWCRRPPYVLIITIGKFAGRNYSSFSTYADGLKELDRLLNLYGRDLSGKVAAEVPHA